MRGVVSVCVRGGGHGDAAAALRRLVVVVPDSRFLGLRATLEELFVEGEELLLAFTKVDESSPNKGGVVGRRP